MIKVSLIPDTGTLGTELPRNRRFQQMRGYLERLRYGLPVVLADGDEDVVCAGVLRVEMEAQGGV